MPPIRSRHVLLLAALGCYTAAPDFAASPREQTYPPYQLVASSESFPAREPPIKLVAFSQDSGCVAISRGRQRLTVFNTVTGWTVNTLAQLGGQAKTLALSGCDGILAVGVESRVQVWSLQSAELILEESLAAPIQDLAITEDARTLAALSEQELLVVSIPDGVSILRQNVPWTIRGKNGLAFSPDATRLAIGLPDSLVLLDTASGSIVWEREGNPRIVGFDAAGETVRVVDEALVHFGQHSPGAFISRGLVLKRLLFLNAVSGELLRQATQRHHYSDILVHRSGEVEVRRKNKVVFDNPYWGDTIEAVPTIQVYPSLVDNLAPQEYALDSFYTWRDSLSVADQPTFELAPDGKMFALWKGAELYVGSLESTIYWKPVSKPFLRASEVEISAHPEVLSVNGDQVAISLVGEQRRKLRARAHEGSVVSANSRVWHAQVVDRSILVIRDLSALEQERQCTIRPGAGSRPLRKSKGARALSPDLELLALVWKGKLYVFQTRDCQLSMQARLFRGKVEPEELRFSADSRHLWARTRLGSLRFVAVWGTKAETAFAAERVSQLATVGTDPDLILVKEDGSLERWSLKAERTAWTVELDEPSTGLAVHPAGAWALSSSDSGKVWQIDLETGSSFPVPITSAGEGKKRVAVGRKSIATITARGSIKFWTPGAWSPLGELTLFGHQGWLFRRSDGGLDLNLLETAADAFHWLSEFVPRQRMPFTALFDRFYEPGQLATILDFGQHHGLGSERAEDRQTQPSRSMSPGSLIRRHIVGASAQPSDGSELVAGDLQEIWNEVKASLTSWYGSTVSAEMLTRLQAAELTLLSAQAGTPPITIRCGQPPVVGMPSTLR